MFKRCAVSRPQAVLQRNYALFDKILIANRGEIACRIMRTCKRMGIKTVAVYSEADANAVHVRTADEAVCIGPAQSSKSYLVMERILEVIKQTGAQAVHPGYGFLSENMQFAKLLEDNGVVFIGPGAEAVTRMGDKLASKVVARAAKVNLVPGGEGEVKTAEEALAVARKIEYPVMLKAVHGGGGKGMRVARSDSEVIEGFKLCKQEALSAFGNDAMLVEKFVDNPRHIEIQILADSYGKTLYLCERECSIQRRNQKVIEEAPSPFLTPERRKAMGEQAVALAKAVGYRSAGTVEMMVDGNTGGFFFLEMNTRLQVEHPVTELITGIDIVEQMIRVAAGERLQINQEDIAPRGWALESRVYAEDPLRNFLPSIGRLTRYVEPQQSASVRVDSGVREGGEISMFYDPLIAKVRAAKPLVCSYGRTRAEAVQVMREALDRFVVRGPRHNINFLRSVLENKRFNSGNITTKFIAEEYADGFKGHQFTKQETSDLVAITSVLHWRKTVRLWDIEGKQPTATPPDLSTAYITFADGKKFKTVLKQVNHNSAQVDIEGEGVVSLTYKWDLHEPLFEARFGDRTVVVQPLEEVTHGYRVQHIGTEVDVHVWDEQSFELRKYLKPKVKKDMSRVIVSPMPGTVVSVECKVGDKVFEGQGLAVLEAMKMQNLLRAPKDAVVKKINVQKGSEVAVDQVLIEFEA